MTGTTLRSEPRRRSRGRRRSAWSPKRLSNLRAWYDAELGQPKYSGVGAYVQLDGASTDNISTPDSVATSFSNDIEVIMRVYVNDWTTAANQTLCGKYLTTGNQRSWRFYVTTTGAIGLTASVDGTAVTSIIVTPTTPFVDATWYWLRLRLDLTNGANSVGTVEYAADTGDNTIVPTVWTANGTNTGTTIAGIFDSTAVTEVGGFTNGTLERLSGRVGRFILRSGFDGTTVADFNAADCYGDGYWHSGGYRWTLGLPKVYDRSGNNVAPATFGSGSNQPKWLPWLGSAAFHNSTTTGNSLSTPYSEAHRFGATGSIEIILAEPVLALGGQFQAGGNVTSGGGGGGCSLRVTSAGLPLIRWHNGTGFGTSTSTVPVPIGTKQLKAQWASNQVEFHAAPADGAYVLLDTVAMASNPNSSGGAAAFFVGSNNGSSFWSPWGINRVVATIDGATVLDFNAELCGQSGYTDTLGNVWTVSRASSGHKAVVQSPAARSARSLILHATDDWIDVPAAAVPALDTFAAASSVAASFRRWHNPGAAGHAIFATKATSASTALGLSFRLNTIAADERISTDAGSGSASDGVDFATVALGARGVAMVAVGNAAPFVSGRANDSVLVADNARSTTVTTSTGGAGRIGAYTGGTGAIDMEFEALVCRDAVTSELEHDRLVRYYRGGV